MKWCEFKTYHPIVNFVYFVFVIGFSCFLMHPVCLAISLLSALVCSAVFKGKKAIKTNLIYMVPAVVGMAVVNPLINHEGITILTYLPSGNPLTLESAIYGIAAAVMIVSVICWFSCYNSVMTSDKFIYLFGKVIPSLSLVLSMTLRFVPRFLVHLKEVVNARRCVGQNVTNGNITQRAKHGTSVLSVMTTWALENSIETADSMKARGYGLSGRTSFSVYKFDRRDKTALFWIAVLGIYILLGTLKGGLYFSFFPQVVSAEISPFNISIFAAYFALCISPLIIELWEVRRWRTIKSKI